MNWSEQRQFWTSLNKKPGFREFYSWEELTHYLEGHWRPNVYAGFRTRMEAGEIISVEMKVPSPYLIYFGFKGKP